MPLGKEQTLQVSRVRPSLVVLGMQCSGVEMLGSALSRCGAFVVEREGLQTLCDDLLQDRAGRGKPGGERHTAGQVCVHIVRNPLAVARALQADRDLKIAEALALWEAYNTTVREMSEDRARTLVSYEELVADPRKCVGELLQTLEGLGLRGLELPAGLALELRFSRMASDDQTFDSRDLTPSQRELWRQLSSGKAPGGFDRPEARREALERTLAARVAEVAELKAKVKGQTSEINILNQRIEWLDRQVMDLQASSSWRITAPLRDVSVAMRKLRTRLGGGGKESPVRRADAMGARERLPAALEGEDTFALYRIIGNDLYPRHKRGQATENLRFILEHEPELEGCEKRFILNRILDTAQEQQIMGLLDRAGFQYVRIPFDANEYTKVGFDTDSLPEPDFLAGERFETLDEVAKGRLYAALYRQKNNYVMNNNGARNTALEDGRGRAKWILPWDGNCFLTASAWKQIRMDIAAAPENRYFVVPMARMPGNGPLVNGGAIPKATEEPQIIFRTDASERFNEAFCYGRRPKVELLWRLGVEGPWDEYPDDPWDQARAPLSPEADAVGRAGWVARLFSGMATLEANSDQAPLHRGLARSGAILTTLQHLDARLAGMDSGQPVSIRMDVLRKEIENQGALPLKEVVGVLREAADEVMAGRQASPQRAFADSVVLALAWSFTGADRYAERGSDLLHHLFVQPGTRLAPPLADENGVACPSPVGMTGLHHCLDAVRILEDAGAIADPVRSGIRTWLDAWLEWLLTSPEGRAERSACDHRATSHDLQVASAASFLEEHEVVYASLMRAQARIGGQFAPDGSQPGEIGGPLVVDRYCFNLQCWTSLAELASRWGVDLWGHQAKNGSGLRQGARWLLSYAGRPGIDGQAKGFDAGRLQPIRFAATEFIDDLPSPGECGSSPYAANPVFSPDTGIRPFWNLASYGQPDDIEACPHPRRHELLPMRGTEGGT